MRLEQAVTQLSDSVLIRIFCVPGAKRRAVTGMHAKALKVKVTARASDQGANVALVELLSEVLDVPRSAVEISSGRASRSKTVSVNGVSVQEVVERLARVIAA